MASRVVYERSGKAPIRATINASGGELALFSAGDRKRILVAALRTGAEYYRQKYVPQLFTGRIYRAPFNYVVKPRYASKKSKLGLPPLVGPDNPSQPTHLRDAALNDSYVTVDVNDSRATMIIHIPGVNHVNANHMVTDIVRTLPEEWLNDVARVVGETIKALLATSNLVSPNTRQVSPEVRQAIGSLSRRVGWQGGAPRRVPGHG